MNDVKFSIHSGGMICGSADAEKQTYKMIVGKSGLRWLVAIQPNEGDHIYVEGKPNSDGFAGRTLSFNLESGEVINLTGPWKSNSDSLLQDTGYDATYRHGTIGVVALKVENGKHYNDPNTYSEVLYADKDWTLGEYDRILKIAQQFANQKGLPVAYAMKSYGGGSSGWMQPKVIDGMGAGSL